MGIFSKSGRIVPENGNILDDFERISHPRDLPKVEPNSFFENGVQAVNTEEFERLNSQPTVPHALSSAFIMEVVRYAILNTKKKRLFFSFHKLLERKNSSSNIPIIAVFWN